MSKFQTTAKQNYSVLTTLPIGLEKTKVNLTILFFFNPEVSAS